MSYSDDCGEVFDGLMEDPSAVIPNGVFFKPEEGDGYYKIFSYKGIQIRLHKDDQWRSIGFSYDGQKDRKDFSDRVRKTINPQEMAFLSGESFYFGPEASSEPSVGWAKTFELNSGWVLNHNGFFVPPQCTVTLAFATRHNQGGGVKSITVSGIHGVKPLIILPSETLPTSLVASLDAQLLPTLPSEDAIRGLDDSQNYLKARQREGDIRHPQMLLSTNPDMDTFALSLSGENRGAASNLREDIPQLRTVKSILFNTGFRLPDRPADLIVTDCRIAIQKLLAQSNAAKAVPTTQQ